MSLTHRLAGLVVGLGRGIAARLPKGVKHAIDDRVFGAIFQVTRVTNDAYGWPAPPPGGMEKPRKKKIGHLGAERGPPAAPAAAMGYLRPR